MKKNQLRIALLIETSKGHGRQIIQGVSRFSTEHGPWSLRLESRNLNEAPPEWLKHWSGDGILVRCDDKRMAKIIQKCSCPVVDLRGGVPEANLPLVGVDNQKIIHKAIQYFMDRGFSNFAYCDSLARPRFWMDLRSKYFIERMAETDKTYSLFLPKLFGKRISEWTQDMRHKLAEWLLDLPKPVAILACDDEQAHLICDTLKNLSINVPESVAVLGIDNDELFCSVSTPPLSSIDVNAEQVGYEGAATLEKLIKGERVPLVQQISPKGIVTRQSTDIFAVDDPKVALALQYIRSNASNSIGAENVADLLKVSRGTLDRYLIESVGQTATQLILKSKLDRVKILLRKTDFPLTKIAEETSFASAQHLASVFRKKTGMTPGQFKKKMT